MALLIEDDETDRLVRHFAEIKGLGPVEAVKLAIEDQLNLISLKGRIRPRPCENVDRSGLADSGSRVAS